MEHPDNRILLRGTVSASAEYSHEVRGLEFYRFPLAVPRLSGQEDLLTIVTRRPEDGVSLPHPGQPVEVRGEIRSFNNRSGQGSRLVITVLAHSILPAAEEPCNLAVLRGRLCKAPTLRRTPLGRDICDLLLAVERRYHRSDYLPCIAWGRLALECAGLHPGDPLFLEGRLQSRLYRKVIGEISQERTAYEVSVSRMILPDQETTDLQ